MIRAVLVERLPGDWRIYRQAGWMAEVRRDPGAASLPRRFFDIDEDAFRQALDAWEGEGAGASLDAALGLLGRLGAVEIAGPSPGGRIGP